ncbi:MAG: hypothetical protein IOD12_14910 [Silvanigrellales bacterium]|nr:hypothetical protein [Silvanigrellales bacterium]
MNSATHLSRSKLTCIATTPTRVDLAGGTLDISPLAAILQEKHDLWNKPVQTVNVAIDLRATARIDLTGTGGNEPDDLHWTFEDLTQPSRESGTTLTGEAATNYPLHRAVVRYARARLLEAGFRSITLSTNAQAPKGSGLGGSSSVVIAILGAIETLLKTQNIPSPALCEVAKNLEAGLLGGLAGNQDHFGAAFGGVQAVQHCADGSTTRRLACNGTALLSHIVLAHSGQQHFSAFNNWLILERVLTGHKPTLGKLASIARIAHEIVDPLEKGDFEGVAKLVSQEWEYRRVLAEGVTTPVLDALHAASLRAGAWGGKVCGAGGGGVLVMFVSDPAVRKRVEQAIVDTGGVLLPARYSDTGLVVSTGEL